MKFGTTYAKPFPILCVNYTKMKTQTRNKQSIVKGIKLTFLTIILQSLLLGFALVLKANDMLPADFVNYSGRLTIKDSPADVMVQKKALKQKKTYSANTVSQNDLATDELSGETSELSSAK